MLLDEQHDWNSSACSASMLYLLLLTLTNSAAAMSTLEGAAEDSMMAASTYSVAAVSNSTSLQPHSRRKRSILFPTGSDLDFAIGLDIPISALSATSECLKILPYCHSGEGCNGVFGEDS